MRTDSTLTINSKVVDKPRIITVSVTVHVVSDCPYKDKTIGLMPNDVTK